ncbi:hypothetical protein [Streptomyces fulvoviolaceus]|uniref:hypothetical protein n=1 Tax=Streptomyces fulvoviolaceus TaxID=285535 RepID=UPI0021BE4F67|nr:hypothetical protein [Streptomyces fulvoviolaceus]MCT9076931.1 hypothetical protein [Streptomyces fulvoviolaceus]
MCQRDGLPADDDARWLIDSRTGLTCRWWQKRNPLPAQEIASKLTVQNLNLHVNHFESTDPATGLPFYEETPFISLSCGTVERDTVAMTNFVHTARHTALWFGTQFGKVPVAYLYVCWVVLAPRSAVAVEGVAEEVRDLNTYRRYSPYQTEGEVAAKIAVPANQISQCEKWEWERGTKTIRQSWIYRNPGFVEPEALSNVREML